MRLLSFHYCFLMKENCLGEKPYMMKHVCACVFIRVLQGLVVLVERRWIQPFLFLFLCAIVVAFQKHGSGKAIEQAAGVCSCTCVIYPCKAVNLIDMPELIVLLSLLFIGRHRTARWQRREGVNILPSNNHCSPSFCSLSIFLVHLIILLKTTMTECSRRKIKHIMLEVAVMKVLVEEIDCV